MSSIVDENRKQTLQEYVASTAALLKLRENVNTSDDELEAGKKRYFNAAVAHFRASGIPEQLITILTNDPRGYTQDKAREFAEQLEALVGAKRKEITDLEDQIVALKTQRAGILTQDRVNFNALDQQLSVAQSQLDLAKKQLAPLNDVTKMANKCETKKDILVAMATFIAFEANIIAAVAWEAGSILAYAAKNEISEHPIGLIGKIFSAVAGGVQGAAQGAPRAASLLARATYAGEQTRFDINKDHLGYVLDQLTKFADNPKPSAVHANSPFKIPKPTDPRSP